MRWTHLEEALFMELYPLSRDAGNPSGMTWIQVASTMNLHISERNLDLPHRFTASNIRMNFRNHKEGLKKRWGNDWGIAALVARNAEAVAKAGLIERANFLESDTTVSRAGEKGEAVQVNGTSALDDLAEVCVARLAVEYFGTSEPGNRRSGIERSKSA